MSSDDQHRNPRRVAPCQDHEERLRIVERWKDRCDGSKPAQRARLDQMETDIRGLRELMEKRDEVYAERFGRITKTIAWSAGALSALVFFAQVLLPMLRNSRPEPIIVQLAPQEPGASD